MTRWLLIFLCAAATALAQAPSGDAAPEEATQEEAAQEDAAQEDAAQEESESEGLTSEDAAQDERERPTHRVRRVRRAPVPRVSARVRRPSRAAAQESSAATTNSAPAPRPSALVTAITRPQAESEASLNALDLAVGFSLFHRSYAYHDDLYARLRAMRITAPALSAALVWYPAAHFTEGALAHFGLDLRWQQAFAAGVRDDEDALYPTRSRELYAGIRGRYFAEEHEVSLSLGYGAQHFVFEPATPRGDQTSTPRIPGVSYQYVALGLQARFQFLHHFSLSPSFAWLFVLDAGGVQSALWFPNAEVGGLRAGLEFGFAFGAMQRAGFEARISLDYRRYFFTLHPETTATHVAGGALDQYLVVGVGLAYRL